MTNLTDADLAAIKARLEIASTWAPARSALIHKDVPALLVEVAALRQQLDRRDAVVSEAPHEGECPTNWYEPGGCTCFKMSYESTKGMNE